MGALAHSLQSAVGAWPRLYVGLQRARHRGEPYARRIVSSSTQVVIEGFPRSGNSFANRAFADSQPQKVRVATHAHHAAQVRRGVALGIPTLVVVRHPAQCIPSHYALREQTRRADASQPPFDVTEALKRYVEFHRDVLKVESGIMLVRFEDVIDDYGDVIRRLNQRFGCDFVPFEHNDENVARLFASAKTHLSPSDARRADNERGAALYREAPGPLRARAEALYQRVCAAAEQQARNPAG